MLATIKPYSWLQKQGARKKQLQDAYFVSLIHVAESNITEEEQTSAVPFVGGTVEMQKVIEIAEIHFWPKRISTKKA